MQGQMYTATTTRVKAAIRVRPFLESEVGIDEWISFPSHDKISVSDFTKTVDKKYDYVFTPDCKQSDVYSFVDKSLEGILKGINSTIFAYGQTGSGKTFTMFGKDWESNVKKLAHEMHQAMKTNEVYHGEEILDKLGLIPRVIQEVFYYCSSKSIDPEDIKIYLSFLQIYNEKIYDLFQDADFKSPLQIRQDKENGIYVEGLSEYQVSNSLDAYALLKRGERNRIIRATKINMESSRSHSIFQFFIEYNNTKVQKIYKTKLNFCDLAGSEKMSTDENLEEEHMKELKSINLSLTTLGKVINWMAHNKSSYIPYRESKLTRFLQDSLGKNANTWLIATVSPTLMTFDETWNTLKFADQAMKIKAKILSHSIEVKESEKINELQKEISYLKDLLNLKRNGNTEDVHRQLYMLKKENSKLREIAKIDKIAPRNIFTGLSSIKSSTSAKPNILMQGTIETDMSRDFLTSNLPNIGNPIESHPNRRYDTVNSNEDDASSYKVPIKTNSTGLTSNNMPKISRGRSSTDLQYAGAKILTGNYSKKYSNNLKDDIQGKF